MLDIRTKRYTKRQAARKLKVSTRTLDRWRKAHSAPDGVTMEPIPVGGRLYYTDELIQDYLRRREQRSERLRNGGPRGRTA